MNNSAHPVTPIQSITSPFVRFAKMGAAGGIVLLVSTVISLVWANSPWQHSYHQLLETQVSVGFGNFVVTENRHEWINDGLMAIFFFLVGLEIKREVLVGELSSLRKSALPFVAALGGMIVPALLYLAVANGDFRQGWAIPLSTDIAFALGMLAFLGSRVPLSLKVFVTALAIVDDIFAVMIIALFYTTQLNYVSLLIGLFFILVSLAANLLGVRKPVVYAVIGIFAWCAVLSSGVHATIAGILLAFTIPSRTLLNRDAFLKQSRSLLDQLETTGSNSANEHAILHTLEQSVELVESPLQRIEHLLQPWVSFLIMPLFALANAGVNFSESSGSAKHPVTIGIVLGLVLGKPLGIFLFSFAAVKTKIALPLASGSWRHLIGAACLCGIGFTMSLFIASLAFGDSPLLDTAKIAILFASIVSGILGVVLLLTRSTAEARPALAAGTSE